MGRNSEAASRVEPSLSGGERSNSQQPIAQHRADASDLGVWQDLESWLMRARSPHARPSRAGPTLHAGVAPPEIGDFAMANGRRAKNDWVFTGQTATPAQIEMLRSRDLKPTRGIRTTTFTILGCASHGGMARRRFYSSQTVAGPLPLTCRFERTLANRLSMMT